MAKIKLTKTAVEAAQPQAKDVELRDTVVPGFLCKITPTGRRVFMLQYRTNSGQPRKPSLGLYGELTVEQARVKAQDWLAEVRRGGDPGGAKAEARKAPTMAELCKKFMEDYSKKVSVHSTTYWTYFTSRRGLSNSGETLYCFVPFSARTITLLRLILVTIPIVKPVRLSKVTFSPTCSRLSACRFS